MVSLFLLLSLGWSCASRMPRLSTSSSEQGTILEIQHAYSKRPSDCLAVCVGMVQQYYGVETVLPDTAFPLELIALSKSLNTGTPVDDEGHVLFSTVLELTPDELTAHLAKRRPLIVVFQPSARADYHSVVLSGYRTERGSYYVHDPARRKPSWKKLSKIPTFGYGGKYLVLLIGLSEK